jgi:putative flippase GtrA
MLKQAFKKTDSTYHQLLRYALVGGFAFIVDFSALYFFTAFLGLHYLQSAALAFLLGLTTNYLFSVIWVFSQRTMQSKTLEFLVFALLGVFGLGLNHLLMYLFTGLVGFHYLFSKGISTGIVFVWNFVTRKLLLFSKWTKTAPEAQDVLFLATLAKEHGN